MIASLPSAFAAFFLEIVRMDVAVRLATKSLVESQHSGRDAEEGGGID